MIVGIGIDVIDVHKIAENGKSNAFQRKVFTPAELESCEKIRNKVECLAGKFAAKEAFMKAIGMGIRQEVWFTQIEVLNRESGEPYLEVKAEAQQQLRALGVTRVHVSISHDPKVGVAMVVLER